jgi:hypothetical protein
MITKIKYIIQDFWSFLKHPSIGSSNRVGFFYYLIVLALVMIIAGIVRIGIPILFTILDFPVIYTILGHKLRYHIIES